MSEMKRSMTIGSLAVSEYPNGLVQLRLTALRKGEPVSILSKDQIKDIDAFLNAPDPVEDDDDWRDLV